MRYSSNLVLLGLLAVTTACVKTAHDFDNEHAEIEYSMSVPATKVMGHDDFLVPGNQMKVYDIFSTGSKTINYIDGEVIVSPEEEGQIWDYAAEGKKYYWLEGTHEFFGYNINNVKKGSVETAKFSDIFDEPTLSGKTLTLTQKAAFDVNSSQFDFVYSDLVERVISEESDNTETVDLNCKHAFSAFGISVENLLPDDKVTIENIKVINLVNKGDATISFSKDGSSLTLANPTKSKFVDYTPEGGMTLSEGTGDNRRLGTNAKPDAFNKLNDEKGYYITWPQEDLTAHPSTDSDGNVTYEETDPLIVVDYKIWRGDDPSSFETVSKSIPFPKGADEEKAQMEAGKLYNYTISFTYNQMVLKVVVKDWVYNEEIVNYEDNTIAVANPQTDNILKPVEGTYRADADDPYTLLFNESWAPIEFTFCLDKPTTGRWMAKIIGDFEAFEFVGPSSGEIKHSVEGVPVPSTIRIKPVQGLDNTKVYRAQLEFSVQMPNGRIAKADDRLQPVKYTIKLTR